MAEGRYAGRGIHFPIQVDQATGRICMSGEIQKVKESIYLILKTQKTERWLRPDFGSNLNSYTFMDTNLTMLNIMARELKESILSQEPRISELSVRMDPQGKPGFLLIDIEYTVNAAKIRDNLVFAMSSEHVPERADR